MYDPELLAGFQDADFEMRDLEAQAAESARQRALGNCDHGWHQGFPNGKDTTPGTVFCFHCEQVVADPFVRDGDGCPIGRA